MMNNLRIVQEHRNALRKNNFGRVGLSPDVADKIIIAEEIRIMRRRVLCSNCFEYKSTSGSCSC